MLTLNRRSIVTGKYGENRINPHPLAKGSVVWGGEGYLPGTNKAQAQKRLLKCGNAPRGTLQSQVKRRFGSETPEMLSVKILSGVSGKEHPYMLG